MRKPRVQASKQAPGPLPTMEWVTLAHPDFSAFQYEEGGAGGKIQSAALIIQSPACPFLRGWFLFLSLRISPGSAAHLLRPIRTQPASPSQPMAAHPLPPFRLSSLPGPHQHRSMQKKHPRTLNHAHSLPTPPSNPCSYLHAIIKTADRQFMLIGC